MTTANIRSIREKQERLAGEARAILDSITPDLDEGRAAELNEQADRAFAEFDKLEERAAREERAAAMAVRLNSSDPRRPVGDARSTSGLRETTETTETAFRSYLLNGMHALTAEQRRLLMPTSIEGRAQATSPGSAGGFTVPQTLANELVVSLKAFSPMLDPGVTRQVVTTAGEPISFPTNDDTAAVATIIGENTEINPGSNAPGDLTFGSKALGAFKYTTGLIRVSMELAQDSVLNMEAEIRRAYATRLGRGVGAHLTTGGGTTQPCGIVTRSSLGFANTLVPTVNTPQITFDDLIELEHSVDAAYRADPSCGWQFNDNTLKLLRKLKSPVDGHYIWQPANVVTGAPATISGYRYSVNPAMANLNYEAKAPRATDGVLEANLSADSTTTFFVQCPGAVPDVWQYFQMSTTLSGGGLLRINDELIRFTASAGNTGTGRAQFGGTITRGVYGTTPDDHDEGDTVQWGWEWIDAKPWQVVRDLLINFAGVPDDWIDTEEWEAEHDRWLLPFDSITGFIVDPDDTDNIIANILNSIQAFIWTDVRARKIRFQASRPAEGSIVALDDREDILADSMSRRVEMNEQVSRVEVWYDVIDGSDSLIDSKNYRSARVVEGPRYGLPRARQIVTRWLQTQLQASVTGNSLLTASGVPPIYVTVDVGVNNVGRIGPGTPIRLTSRILQDETGQLRPTMFIVTEANEIGGEKLRLTMRTIGMFVRLSNWTAPDAPDWQDADDDQKVSNGFWTNDSGLVDGENPESFWA